MKVTQSEAIAAVDLAFGALSKPDHFTDYWHCEECLEHDELLRSRTRETLAIQDVANPVSDPLCFSHPEGIAFYMPSLARWVFAKPTDGYGWYGHQLLFHLYSGGLYNAFYQYCSAEQRAAMAMLIGAMIESNTSDIESTASEGEFLRAHEIWSHGRA